MFTRFLLSAIFLIPLVSCAEDKLVTVEQQASYAVGVDIGNQLKKGQVHFDAEVLAEAIEDTLKGNELRLTQEEMTLAKEELMKQVKAMLEEQQNTQAAGNLESGNLFLAENAKKEGVTTTESGLQYKVITAGAGATPTETDTVVTHYRGTLIDGREFDSSYSRNKPATFPVKGVIKGWTEALQLMKVGAKWQLFIPSNIAYGASKRSELILPNTALIFEIELLEIK